MSDRYKVEILGQRRPILWQFERNAEEIDRDHNRILTLAEFAAIASRLPGGLSTDEDFALGMAYEYAGLQNPYALDYPNSSEVEAKIRSIAEAHPENSALRLLGSTSENRPVWALRLGPRQDDSRPKVAIIATQHAREWIAPQVALAAVASLLDDPEQRDILQTFEVWVVPLSNPDGYDYSLSTDAMWRKNRRGVDLNRNFDADFRRPGDRPEGVHDDWGASDYPESAQYRGPGPASEAETRVLQELLSFPGMVGVIDVHGFGNKIVLPNVPTHTSNDLYQSVATAMSQAMAPDYEILRYEQLYPITGHLGAYADGLGIPGVTLEVGRAFHPNPSKIPAVSKQAVEGILAYLRALPSFSKAEPSSQ